MPPAPLTRSRSVPAAAFTLVEMLAVAGVIVILLAATLPALRGFTQSESRHAAVSAVMATLDRARMTAIADGRATYVVFLARNATPDGPAINATAFGRAYAIYEDNDNVNFLPVQQTPWMYLPVAMAFKVNAASAGVSGGTASVTNRLDGGAGAGDPAFRLAPAVLANPSGNAANTGTHLPYLKFDGTGAVDESTPQYLRVLLFPGVVSTAGVELPTQAAANAQVSLTRLEEMDVNVATGRAKYVVNPAENLSTIPTSP